MTLFFPIHTLKIQLPYAVFAFNPILRRFPGICENGVALMTSSVFNIPFLRHVYSWVKGKSGELIIWKYK